MEEQAKVFERGIEALTHSASFFCAGSSKHLTSASLKRGARDFESNHGTNVYAVVHLLAHAHDGKRPLAPPLLRSQCSLCAFQHPSPASPFVRRFMLHESRRSSRPIILPSVRLPSHANTNLRIHVYVTVP